MQPSVPFLTDLTVAIAAAALASFVAVRLRLHPILGYLAAGIAIGPFTPGYVARGETLNTLATLGLIFLLFSLGLGFSFGEVRKLGAVPLVGNALVMLVAGVVAGVGGHLVGFQHPLTIALAVAVSSTAVGAALLQTWHVGAERAGRYALAQLVVQDLIAVALLVLVTAPAPSLSPAGVAIPVLKAVGFVALALILGETVLQRLVRRIITHATSEGLFVGFAALALIAAWLGYAAGLSFEFGAFVAGAVISEAAGSMMVASAVASFRSLFVALFFVSVGMVLDPAAIAAQWVIIAGLGVTLIVVRFAAWTALAAYSKMALGAAVLVGTAMTAMGEFNVVLVDAASSAKRLTPAESQVLLGVTFLSIVIVVVTGPYLSRWTGAGREAIEPEGDIAPGTAPRAAIVGFGRVGHTVGEALADAGVAFVAVERDRDAVVRARAEGFTVVYGDALDPATLDRALGPSVRVVLLTLPDSTANGTIADRVSRRGMHVVARAARSGDLDALRERGVASALVPEVEGALAFARAALRDL